MKFRWSNTKNKNWLSNQGVAKQKRLAKKKRAKKKRKRSK